MGVQLTPAVFLSRIQAVDGMPGVYACAICRGVDPNKEGSWETVFLGTEEECNNYTKNLHHAINPDMIDKFDPRSNVKRILS